MMQQIYRLRTHMDEMEDIDRESGRLPGTQRCAAIGLERGDCKMHRHLRPGGEVSAYCYYHDKLALGLIEPSAPVYPVFPLPAPGYVFVEWAFQVRVA